MIVIGPASGTAPSIVRFGVSARAGSAVASGAPVMESVSPSSVCSLRRPSRFASDTGK